MSLDPKLVEIEELVEAFKTGKIAATDYSAAMIKSAKDLTSSSIKFGSIFTRAADQVEAGAVNFATAMADGKQGASAFNGAINSTSGALVTLLNAAGLVGSAFGKVTEFATAYVVRANQQGDALFKSFQDLSRVGGASAEGMTDISSSMLKFGLTMNQLPEFGEMITKNSEALAQLGGTVTQGTKTFAGVAAGIQQSGLQTEFERMGLTTKDINVGTVNYLRLQAMNAANSTKSTAALTAGAEEYIRQQDKLSRLTGKSADALAKEQEEQMKDQRYRAYSREQAQKEAELRAAGTTESIAQADAMAAQQKETVQLLGSLKGDMNKAARDLISGGTVAGSKEAQQMFKLMPEMAQKLMTGSFEASKTLQNGSVEAGKALNQLGGLAKVSGFDEVFGKFHEYADFEAQQLALKKTGVNAPTVAQTDLATGGNVDINNQVALRQSQLATTQAVDQLVQKGVPALTAGMLSMATSIEKAVTGIPGLDAKTSTSATGRGKASPATASYETDFKLTDLADFINTTAAKAFEAMTKPVVPERPSNQQIYEGMSGKSKNITVNNVYEGMSGKPKIITGNPVNQGSTGKTTNVAGTQTNNTSQPAGPNTTYRSNLDDTTPTNVQTKSSAQESNAGGNAELTQSIMTLAKNIGSQTTSMDELVELMRRSVGTQAKILQQARN